MSVKVHDGLVLAADSASTVFGSVETPEGRASGALNVFPHANKIFNLRKGLPVGMMTWGRGSIGDASISTLAKDLRVRLTDSDDDDWKLDPASYDMRQVANHVRRFFYENRYKPIYEGTESEAQIGFMIAGYSGGEDSPEIWQVSILGDQCPEPTNRRSTDETGIDWSGDIEPISRIVHGHGTALPQALNQLGVDEEQIRPAMQEIQRSLAIPLHHPPMPIQDAIDLAEFLVDTAIKYSRFKPGAPTCGGPIEIAAITKHEGFKWVQRKHYYPQELNPKTDHQSRLDRRKMRRTRSEEGNDDED